MKENIDDNKCSLNDKGIAALQDGDWNRARVAFEAACHTDQNIGALWNNLGYTYLQLGEYERAKNALERSISLGDIELDAWCNIAQLYEQMGDFKSAEQACAEALSIDSNEPIIFGVLARIYAASGLVVESEKCYLRLIELQPESLTHRLALANLYLVTGMLAEAEEVYLDVLQFNEKAIPAMFGLGQVCQSRNEFQRAAFFYQRIKEIDPDQFEAKLGLAYLAIAEGNCDEAIGLLDIARVSAVSDQLNLVYTAYAQAHFLKDETDEARDFIEVVLQNEPRNIVAMLCALKVYEKLGRVEDVERMSSNLESVMEGIARIQ